MVKGDEDWSGCPFCGFEGMMNSGDRCDHMQKDPYHLGKVMEWINRGPDGRPKLELFREHNLRDSGVNLICWAAGYLMKTK